MTINKSIDLFPKTIVEREGDLLETYLATTDFSYGETVKRCHQYIEQNSKIKDEKDKVIIHRAVRKITKQILDNGIPPYLWERNLPNCKFLPEPFGDTTITDQNSIFISAYFYAVNQVHYLQHGRPKSLLPYLRYLRNLMDSKTKIPTTFESLCYGLQQLASSYSDQCSFERSGIGLEADELSKTEQILGTDTHNYLRQYLTANGQVPNHNELCQVLTRINKGITELMVEKIATYKYARNKELVVGLHQDLGISLDDVISCYYTANREKYINLLNEAVIKKERAKVLKK